MACSASTSPKGTDLSVHGPDYLEFVAVEMNRRPRETLGWLRPAQALARVLSAASEQTGVAVFVNPFETPGGPNQLVSITSSRGRLIHAGPGSCGGSGALRPKREVCDA